MNMYLKHTRPYNHEHAQKGAPIGLRNGGEVKILHVTPEKLIGMERQFGADHVWGACEWGLDGRYIQDDGNTVERWDIVMLPLGLIDGRPMFVGDDMRDRWGNKITAYVGMGDDPAHWFWPSDEQKYPQTSLSDAELLAALNISDQGVVPRARAIANAAIVRVIQDGMVVPADMLDKVALLVRNRCTATCVEFENGVQLERQIAGISLAAIIDSVKGGAA